MGIVDYYYFDASVLVKAYLWEAGTDEVRRVVRDARADPPLARIGHFAGGPG